MWRYLELLSGHDLSTLSAWKKEVEEGLNPRDVKFRMAAEQVERFHGPQAAKDAQAAFIARFREGQIPDEMPEYEFSAAHGPLPLPNVIKDAGLTPSTTEARRMVGQGAVRIDGDRISDVDLKLSAGFSGVLQVGKRRFARVRITG